jgi:hypothetical protein
LAIVLLIGAIHAPVATAQTVPSQMIIGGRINSTPSSPTPGPGNAVNAIDAASDELIGSGEVQDSSGNFSVTLVKPASLNGSVMTLRLVNGCTTYQLAQSSAASAPPVRLTFNGSFPFPTAVTVNPSIGAAVSSAGCPNQAAGASPTRPAAAAAASDSSPATVKADCPSDAPHCDVAGVGVFDQRAIEAMKACLASSHPGPNCDVNGDGVVDTRDLIDLLRAWGRLQRAQNEPAASLAAEARQVSGSAPLSAAANP